MALSFMNKAHCYMDMPILDQLIRSLSTIAIRFSNPYKLMRYNHKDEKLRRICYTATPKANL